MGSHHLDWFRSNPALFFTLSLAVAVAGAVLMASVVYAASSGLQEKSTAAVPTRAPVAAAPTLAPPTPVVIYYPGNRQVQMPPQVIVVPQAAMPTFETPSFTPEATPTPTPTSTPTETPEPRATPTPMATPTAPAAAGSLRCTGSVPVYPGAVFLPEHSALWLEMARDDRPISASRSGWQVSNSSRQRIEDLSLYQSGASRLDILSFYQARMPAAGWSMTVDWDEHGAMEFMCADTGHSAFVGTFVSGDLDPADPGVSGFAVVLRQ